jgi:hypothetical protein
MRERTGIPKGDIKAGTSAKQDGYNLFASYSKVSSRYEVNPKTSLTVHAGQILGDSAIRPPILSRLRGMIRLIRADSASKVNDGLAPAIVLILLSVLYELIAIPVEHAFKLHGLLIFILLILTIGAIALDRSIQTRYSQTERVFHGMLAGMFFWFTASAAAHLQPAESTAQANVIYMLMAAMIVIALWRTVLPIGAKFFSLVFLLNWVGRFIMARQLVMFRTWNFLAGVQSTYAWIALISAGLLILWLFLGSRRQVQRSWAAVGIWFCGMEAISLFLGWPL